MVELNLEAALAQAVALQRAGHLNEAARIYQEILAAQPGHPAALHNLGAVALQGGEAVQGRRLLEAAVAAQPERGEYRLTLAEALLQCGESQAALLALQAAPVRDLPAAAALRERVGRAEQNAVLRREPPAEAAQALLAAYAAGRHHEAEILARQLVAAYPASGFAWKALAAARLSQGREAGAEAERAAALLPQDAEAHFALARERMREGRWAEAEDGLRRAIALRPAFAEAHLNLGIVLKELGHAEAALASFRASVAAQPDFADGHINVGVMLYEAAQPEAAVACFRRAVALRPDYFDALKNLGRALLDLGWCGEAEDCYRRALATRPDEPAAHCDLGNALYLSGDPAAAVACYRQALALKPDFHEAHGNLLMIANGYLTEDSAIDLLQESRAYGARLARLAPRAAPDWRGRAQPEKRLRVGLVSADFRGHPVSFFLESTLAALPRAELELFAYSHNRVEDETTQRLKRQFDLWRPIAALDDAAAEARIRADGIDLLVDLSGHTGGHRLPLFARKPAPLQASWLGYFATTGLAQMDYVIGDRWVLPAEEEGHFVERPWRLPDSYLCFTPPPFALEAGPLPALAEGRLTFGSFNNLAKLNDEVVALWARLLQALPQARLFLKTPQLDDEALRARVRARFAAHGIAAERLLLEGRLPRAELLAAYRRVDIALDPFPYPGGTTSLEALWMGVPVLTRRSPRFVGHVGESILNTAGLAEWVARDDEDYLRRAVALAGDLPALAALRAALRPQLLASPLCDAPRFAGHLAAAWRGMWRDWCARQ